MDNPPHLSSYLKHLVDCNSFYTIQELLPLPQLFSIPLDEEGNGFILYSLKTGKNQLVLATIQRYGHLFHLHHLFNVNTGKTVFHYLAEQTKPQNYAIQISLAQHFLSYDWEGLFNRFGRRQSDGGCVLIDYPRQEQYYRSLDEKDFNIHLTMAVQPVSHHSSAETTQLQSQSPFADFELEKFSPFLIVDNTNQVPIFLSVISLNVPLSYWLFRMEPLSLSVHSNSGQCALCLSCKKGPILFASAVLKILIQNVIDERENDFSSRLNRTPVTQRIIVDSTAAELASVDQSSGHYQPLGFPLQQTPSVLPIVSQNTINVQPHQIDPEQGTPTKLRAIRQWSFSYFCLTHFCSNTLSLLHAISFTIDLFPHMLSILAQFPSQRKERKQSTRSECEYSISSPVLSVVSSTPSNPRLALVFDDGQLSPLHLAVCNGNTYAVDLLLSSGHEPNVRDANGRTALHHSILLQHMEITRLLLANGASSNTADRFGLTALDLAERLLRKEELSQIREGYGIQKRFHKTAINSPVPNVTMPFPLLFSTFDESTTENLVARLEEGVHDSIAPANHEQDPPPLFIIPVEEDIVVPADAVHALTDLITKQPRSDNASFALLSALVFEEDKNVVLQKVNEALTKDADPNSTAVFLNQQTIDTLFALSGASHSVLAFPALLIATVRQLDAVCDLLLSKGADVHGLFVCADTNVFPSISLPTSSNPSASASSPSNPSILTSTFSFTTPLLFDMLRYAPFPNGTMVHTTGTAAPSIFCPRHVHRQLISTLNSLSFNTPLPNAPPTASSTFWPRFHYPVINSSQAASEERLVIRAVPFTTPAHLAAYLGDFHVLHTLCQFGASSFVYDRNGDLPVHLAASSGQSSIIRIWLDGMLTAPCLMERNRSRHKHFDDDQNAEAIILDSDEADEMTLKEIEVGYVLHKQEQYVSQTPTNATDTIQAPIVSIDPDADSVEGDLNLGEEPSIVSLQDSAGARGSSFDRPEAQSPAEESNRSQQHSIRSKRSRSSHVSASLPSIPTRIIQSDDSPQVTSLRPASPFSDDTDSQLDQPIVQKVDEQTQAHPKDEEQQTNADEQVVEGIAEHRKLLEAPTLFSGDTPFLMSFRTTTVSALVTLFPIRNVAAILTPASNKRMIPTKPPAMFVSISYPPFSQDQFSSSSPQHPLPVKHSDRREADSLAYSTSMTLASLRAAITPVNHIGENALAISMMLGKDMCTQFLLSLRNPLLSPHNRVTLRKPPIPSSLPPSTRIANPVTTLGITPVYFLQNLNITTVVIVLQWKPDEILTELLRDEFASIKMKSTAAERSSDENASIEEKSGSNLGDHSGSSTSFDPSRLFQEYLLAGGADSGAEDDSENSQADNWELVSSTESNPFAFLLKSRDYPDPYFPQRVSRDSALVGASSTHSPSSATTSGDNPFFLLGRLGIAAQTLQKPGSLEHRDCFGRTPLLSAVMWSGVEDDAVGTEDPIDEDEAASFECEACRTGCVCTSQPFWVKKRTKAPNQHPCVVFLCTPKNTKDIHRCPSHIFYPFAHDPHRLASSHHRLMLVGWLLASGSKANSRDSVFGCTSLHIAAARGDAKMMRLLLASGANPFLKDRYGMTPLHHACTQTLQQPFSVILSAMMPEGIVPSFPQQISNITAAFTHTTVLTQPRVNVVMSDRQRERFESVCSEKVSYFTSLANQTITQSVFLNSNTVFQSPFEASQASVPASAKRDARATLVILNPIQTFPAVHPICVEASALGRRNCLHILAERGAVSILQYVLSTPELISPLSLFDALISSTSLRSQPQNRKTPFQQKAASHFLNRPSSMLFTHPLLHLPTARMEALPLMYAHSRTGYAPHPLDAFAFAGGETPLYVSLRTHNFASTLALLRNGGSCQLFAKLPPFVSIITQQPPDMDSGSGQTVNETIAITSYPQSPSVSISLDSQSSLFSADLMSPTLCSTLHPCTAPAGPPRQAADSVETDLISAASGIPNDVPLIHLSQAMLMVYLSILCPCLSQSLAQKSTHIVDCPKCTQTAILIQTALFAGTGSIQQLGGLFASLSETHPALFKSLLFSGSSSYSVSSDTLVLDSFKTFWNPTNPQQHQVQTPLLFNGFPLVSLLAMVGGMESLNLITEAISALSIQGNERDLHRHQSLVQQGLSQPPSIPRALPRINPPLPPNPDVRSIRLVSRQTVPMVSPTIPLSNYSPLSTYPHSFQRGVINGQLPIHIAASFSHPKAVLFLSSSNKDKSPVPCDVLRRSTLNLLITSPAFQLSGLPITSLLRRLQGRTNALSGKRLSSHFGATYVSTEKFERTPQFSPVNRTSPLVQASYYISSVLTSSLTTLQDAERILPPPSYLLLNVIPTLILNGEDISIKTRTDYTILDEIALKDDLVSFIVLISLMPTMRFTKETVFGSRRGYEFQHVCLNINSWCSNIDDAQYVPSKDSDARFIKHIQNKLNRTKQGVFGGKLGARAEQTGGTLFLHNLFHKPPPLDEGQQNSEQFLSLLERCRLERIQNECERRLNHYRQVQSCVSIIEFSNQVLAFSAPHKSVELLQKQIEQAKLFTDKQIPSAPPPNLVHSGFEGGTGTPSSMENSYQARFLFAVDRTPQQLKRSNTNEKTTEQADQTATASIRSVQGAKEAEGEGGAISVDKLNLIHELSTVVPSFMSQYGNDITVHFLSLERCLDTFINHTQNAVKCGFIFAKRKFQKWKLMFAILDGFKLTLGDFPFDAAVKTIEFDDYITAHSHKGEVSHDLPNTHLFTIRCHRLHKKSPLDAALTALPSQAIPQIPPVSSNTDFKEHLFIATSHSEMESWMEAVDMAAQLHVLHKSVSVANRQDGLDDRMEHPVSSSDSLITGL
ncbi:hypothetical protein BLNAU_5775 [Blattamonas nauphoetae]|uniref:PH domain-containing protein n=1 Tax=Blattamonas nauphoetae TaxID=2049346 RepID=A0ABQ9Y628_9EUKA|nr:hypothetical protein BLNAU_5775 [Blattamonas nauphoetae]